MATVTDGPYDGARYSDLCRLCASKTNVGHDFNIFGGEGMRDIDKKIETCLPIQVHETDELPKMICQYCFYKLELFVDFRERAIRTEGILIGLFKEILASVKLEGGDPVGKHNHHRDVIVIDINSSQQLEQPSTGADDIILSVPGTQHHQQQLADEALVNINLHDLNRELVNAHQDASLLGTSYPDDDDADLAIIHRQHLLPPPPDYPLQSSDQSQDDKDPLLVEPLVVSTTGTTLPSFPSLEQASGNNPLCEYKREDMHWIACNLCGQNFNDKTLFRTHYERHFYKCTSCHAVFTSEDILAIHQKEAHNQDPAKEVTEAQLERAVISITSKTKDVVDNKIENNEVVASFLDIDPLKDAEVEDDNGSVGAIQSALEEAAFLSTNQKRRKVWTPKVCKECGKTYKSNYKLAEHMRKHTGEKPYKCSSCDKAFCSKIGLAQHEAKHTGQYDLQCSTCGKGFQCKSYLMVHQRVHSDVKPYPCTTCGRNFKTKQSLLDHTNRHLGVKPYMCDICGRGFITKGLCRAHQKVHTGLDNRKFLCKICNKMFVSKSYLRTHLRIHTGEKPFICEVCGKGFLTRVDLKIHSTMHTGEKSYVCETCGKAFARRDALRCHRRSHTGERPYRCDQCGQTFTQFSPMAIHKRLHTGERPYTCDVCGKSFVSRSTMTSHMKKHDNNK